MGSSTDPKCGWVRYALSADAQVTCFSGWLDPPRADGLYEYLRESVAWQQGRVRLFGRETAEPRLTAWFGDRPYVYSGRRLPPTPWPEPLMRVRHDVEKAAETPFNTVLLNRYRDGNDGMGFHSDDESELGPNPCVASVSLGVTRRFVLVPKKPGSGAVAKLELELSHGTLLVMGGTCQATFRHGVPKQRGVAGERISLTFRNVIG